MLPLKARVNLGAMALNGYSTFLIAHALLEPHHQIVFFHIKTFVGGVWLQRCSRCILQPPPSQLSQKKWDGSVTILASTTENISTERLYPNVKSSLGRLNMWPRFNVTPLTPPKKNQNKNENKNKSKNKKTAKTKCLTWANNLIKVIL